MQSFTFASDEAMQALRQKFPAQGYHMLLTPTDMTILTEALCYTFQLGPDGYSEGAHDIDPNRNLSEEAGSLLSAIADTLGIEFI